MKIKRLLCLCLAILTVVSASVLVPGCGRERGRTEDIVILFTNDVHCGIDENVGYAGLAAYKKAVEAKTPYVTLVDCGDHMQGNYIGAVSRGECVVDIMNGIGYDLAILGNHEFDYGMEQLASNIKRANARYLCCNVTYTGKGTSGIAGTEPYAILEYGDTSVAFIGVSTPWSISTSTPAYFMEDGETVYSFASGDHGAELAACVQKYVDECREKGADYVVLCAHLGTTETEIDFKSDVLISATSGIDAVLDGHSHTEMPCRVVENKNGEPVFLAQTGTKLENIGQLVITPSGLISVGFIEDYPEKDAETVTQITQISARYEAKLSEVIGRIDFGLSCYDAAGIRMVRSREIGLGNLVADAYRVAGGADIALVNGGGIRADLAAGEIAYRDIIAVNPFGNMLCVVEVTGAELLDMLEYFYRFVKSEYVEGGRATGEDGSFQQVSGIRLTVDTSVSSSVLTDANDALIGIGETRRVSDVQIVKNGVWEPLDPDATYTLASHNYMIKNGGCGMGVYLEGHTLPVDESAPDYQVLIDYLLNEGDDLARYRETEGRITVR